MPVQRLSAFLAHSGIASRRKADDLISAGNVSVNNIRVIEPFFRVDTDKDIVTVYGKKVTLPRHREYIALYKPSGYISDLKDPMHRRIARDLIASSARLFPVGRLDYSSEGLIFFTDDGDFANRVMHPRYGIDKEYLVKFKGRLTGEDIARAMGGIQVEGERYQVRSISLVRDTEHNGWYRVIVNEGKNRMIRKIGDAIRHPVLKLRRIRIGPVTLRDMAPGHCRHLTPRELSGLIGHTAAPDEPPKTEQA